MTDRLRSLYLCYLTLDDPLVETQVVAYLDGLARRGHTVHLVTWETRRLSRRQRRVTRERLSRRGVAWHSLRYHKRPTVPATIFDVATGIALGLRLIRRHRLTAVHARSHVPAAMGLALRRATGVKLIFDYRGMLAQEYIDAGNWRAGSLPVRITQWIERRAICRADAMVTLTEAVVPRLFPHGGSPPLWVIPCCADVERIRDQRLRRAEIRERLGVVDRAVMVYVGKFGGWYLQREMVELFAAAREHHDDLHFLVLTQSNAALVESEFSRVGIGPADWTVIQVPPDDVGAYLGAADVAISLIRPAASKVSSSPTKIGEYLAAGLPVLSAAGIGDTDELLTRSGTGTLLERFDRAAYREAVDQLFALARDPEMYERCVRTAIEQLGLDSVGNPRYDDLYRTLAREPTPRQPIRSPECSTASAASCPPPGLD